MSGRGWKIFAVAAALVIGAYQVIPESPWWRTGWEVGVGYGGVAAILVGVRRRPPRARLPWWCFAAGIFANATGIAVALYCTDYLGWINMPTPEDWFFLGL